MSNDLKLKLYIYFIYVKKTSVATRFCQMGGESIIHSHVVKPQMSIHFHILYSEVRPCVQISTRPPSKTCIKYT